MTDTFADSCVDAIQWCLDADETDHRMEVEEERAEVEGLGERVGTHRAMTTLGDGMQFLMAMWAWADRGELSA